MLEPTIDAPSPAGGPDVVGPNDGSTAVTRAPRTAGGGPAAVTDGPRRETWAAYAYLCAVGFVMYAIGALTPYLRDDLGLDSIHSMELLSAVTEKYEVDVDMEEVQDITTVGDVVGFLLKLTS